MADPRTSPSDVLAHRYVLLEILGSGGMAVVHRAWDSELQVFRALKILTGVAHKPRVRARLENEARTMKRLAHPNVVTVHDLGGDSDRLYLVMDYIPGGTVMERVQRDGPLPPRMAAGVLRGVLSALSLAHEHGVIHRDIKPHNILLDAEGVAKVTDFGIARIDLSALTRTGSVMGTLAYMPPEQKLSARKVDGRSDVYATGATLFALLTGREPFDLYAAGMDEAIADDFFAGVPDAMRSVIRRATAYRMEDRFDGAVAMAEALEEATETLPQDPTVPPLVAPDRIARARAEASMGPTLVGTASDAITTPERPAAVFTIDTLSRASRALPTTPIPAAVAPPRRRSPALWIVLAAAGVVGSGALLVTVAAVGAVVWWADAPTTLERPPPATPPEESRPPPDAAPVATPPVAIAVDAPPVGALAPSGAATTAVSSPPPAPVPGPPPVAIKPDAVAAVELSAPVVPAPVVPAPLVPSPATSRRTGWSVDVLTDGPDSAPQVVGTLLADADVLDAVGTPGRPKLQAGCQRGKRWLTLDAGVESVNIVPMEAGGMDVPLTYVTVRAEGWSDTIRLNVSKSVMTNILFKGSDLIDRVLAPGAVDIGYYPFGATAPVTARFSNEGLEALTAEMAARCKR